MTNLTTELPPGAFHDKDFRLMVPIDKIVKNKANPRNPNETYFTDPDFKILVENIMQTGDMNHTPIQVFYQEGKYHLIAGHRRLEAVKKAYELRLEEWEERQRGNEPIKVTHINSSLMPTPSSEFEKRTMMFSAEETSKRWGDIRKFNFFRDMVDELPQTTRRNPVALFEQMRKATGMPPSTVKTYCSFIQNKIMADEMGDLSERLPKQGRLKMIRACDRGVSNLTVQEPKLVRELTLETDATSTAAQNKLGKLILNKLGEYVRLRAQGEMSVGPGVAMERTIAEISKPADKIPVDKQEIANWLNTKKAIFRQDVVEQTKRRDDTLNESQKAFAYVSKFEVPKNFRNLSEHQIQAMADDYAACGDYFDQLARKFRDQLRKKTNT